MTAISSRKRGKRRYFWEYSEQLTPAQQERMLRPSEWNRDTLPSNMYQKNGLHHGKKPSSWSQMAVFSLWHLQQSNSPPCQCWEVVFCPGKVEHCESVTQLPGLCRVEHTAGTFSVVSSRGVWMNWELWLPRALSGNPKSSKLSQCDTVNIGWVAWVMFAAHGCSVSAACVSRRLAEFWVPSSGALWYELRTSTEAQLSLCSSLLVFPLWMQHSEALTPLGINYFLKMSS